VNKKGQIQPQVPDGTTFYIGRPALLDPEPAPAALAPEGRVQGRIDLRVDPHPVAAPAGGRPPAFATASPGRPLPTTTLPAIVSDEEYRALRLRGLMRRAAGGAMAWPPGQAARGRSSSSK
jgi:hypothetical protein